MQAKVDRIVSELQQYLPKSTVDFIRGQIVRSQHIKTGVRWVISGYNDGFNTVITQITPHNQNQVVFLTINASLKGAILFWLYKKFLKGSKRASGGFGFRTCPSNIINNKTLAIP